jgi:hypothetical protein
VNVSVGLSVNGTHLCMGRCGISGMSFVGKYVNVIMCEHLLMG